MITHNFVGLGGKVIIFENGKAIEIADNSKVGDVWNDEYVVVLNGFNIDKSYVLKPQDDCIVIKKGEMPSQQLYQKMLYARNGLTVQKKLEQATVAIFGLGGLGSNIAVSLARAGVGNLILIDYDIVEITNLNRQSYYMNDLGKPKTVALKSQLLNINQYITLKLKQVKADTNNIVQLCDNCNIVCEAFDNPQNKAMLVNTVMEKLPDKKIVAASGMAGYYSSNIIKTVKKTNNLYVCGDFEHAAKIGEGLMSARVALCAAHQANMIIRLILGINQE